MHHNGASGDSITQLPSSPISTDASFTSPELQGKDGSSRQSNADATHAEPVSQSQSEGQGPAGGGQHSSPTAVHAGSVSESEKHSPSDGSHQRQSEAVRRLFDKELDNHHEEKLLLAQLAARELRRSVSGDNRDALVEQSVAWAQGSLQVMLQAAGLQCFLVT